MFINDPNTAIWATRCYRQAQVVRETALANRTNPDERHKPEYKPPKRRQPREHDEHTGQNLDTTA